MKTVKNFNYVQPTPVTPNVHFTFEQQEANDGVGFDRMMCINQQLDPIACLPEDIVICLPEASFTPIGTLKLTYSDTGTNFDGTIPCGDGVFYTQLEEGDHYYAIFFDEDDQENEGLIVLDGIADGDDGNLILDMTTSCLTGSAVDFYEFIDEWHIETGHTNLSVSILSYEL